VYEVDVQYDVSNIDINTSGLRIYSSGVNSSGNPIEPAKLRNIPQTGVTAQSGVIFNINAPGVTIEHLSFEHGFDTFELNETGGFGVIQVFTSNTTLSGLQFIADATQSTFAIAIRNGQDGFGHVDNTLIQSVTIGSGSTGASYRGGIGLLAQSGTATITNVTIQSGFIHTTGDSDSIGVAFLSNQPHQISGVSIRGNTFDTNDRGIFLQGSGVSTITIEQNIFDSNGIHVDDSSSPATFVSLRNEILVDNGNTFGPAVNANAFVSSGLVVGNTITSAQQNFINVEKLEAYSTLQAAINDALEGQTIKVRSNATFSDATLSSTNSGTVIVNVSGLTITSVNPPNLATIRNTDASDAPVFDLRASGITITNIAITRNSGVITSSGTGAVQINNQFITLSGIQFNSDNGFEFISPANATLLPSDFADRTSFSPSSSLAYGWSGYAFKISEPTYVSGIIASVAASGISTLPSGAFQAAFFTGYENSDGTLNFTSGIQALVPGSVISVIDPIQRNATDFYPTDVTSNNYTDVQIPLGYETPLLLQPGWYYIAQGITTEQFGGNNGLWPFIRGFDQYPDHVEQIKTTLDFIDDIYNVPSAANGNGDTATRIIITWFADNANPLYVTAEQLASSEISPFLLRSGMALSTNDERLPVLGFEIVKTQPIDSDGLNSSMNAIGYNNSGVAQVTSGLVISNNTFEGTWASMIEFVNVFDNGVIEATINNNAASGTRFNNRFDESTSGVIRFIALDDILVRLDAFDTVTLTSNSFGSSGIDKTLIPIFDVLSFNNLGSTVTTATGLTSGLYTTATWNLVETALALPERTNIDNQNKLAQLTAALSGLVLQASFDALEAEINFSSGLLQADFTTSTYNTFSGVFATSSGLLNTHSDTTVDNSGIVQATTDLINAMIQLEFASEATLSGLVNITTSGLDTSNYTDPAAFITTRTSGIELLEQISTSGVKAFYEENFVVLNETVSGLANLLNTELNQLVFSGLSALEDEYNLVSGLLESNFVSANWPAFEAARQSGLIILTNETASGALAFFDGVPLSSGVIVQVTSGLQTARANLEFIGITQQVRVDISALQTLDESNFEAATWPAFNEALGSGTSILSAIDSSGALAFFNGVPLSSGVIADVTSAIETTKDALVFKGLASLSGLVEISSGLDQSNYTNDSVNPFNTVLINSGSLLVEVIANDGATAQFPANTGPLVTSGLISQIEQALQDAFDNLVYENQVTLSGLVNNTTSGLDSSNYTTVTWTPFNTARTSGIDIINAIITSGAVAQVNGVDVTSGLISEVNTALSTAYNELEFISQETLSGLLSVVASLDESNLIDRRSADPSVLPAYERYNSGVIRIDKTKVDEDLTNFPLTIVLNSGNFSFDLVQTSGADIFFTDTDNNLLPFEVDYFNYDNEVAVYHVLYSGVITSGVENQDILIRFGQVDNYYYDFSAGYQSSGVWANGYVLVMHMGDQLLDSVGSGVTGIINSGTTVIPSSIGQARDFSSTNFGIEIISQYLRENTGGSNVDRSFVIMFSGVASASQQELISYRGGNDNASNSIVLRSSGGIRFDLYDGGPAANYQQLSANNIIPNQLNGYLISTNGANPGVFDGLLNGSSGFIDTSTFNNYNNSNGASRITIGFQLQTTSPSLNYRSFGGSIDELRISDVLRSPAWLSAEYYSLLGELAAPVEKITTGVNANTVISANGFANVRTSGVEIIDAITSSGAIAQVNGTDVTSGLINSVIQELNTQVNGLVVINYVELSRLVLDTTSGLDSSNFTTDSYNAFNTARTSGLSVYNAVEASGIFTLINGQLVTSGLLATTIQELQDAYDNLEFLFYDDIVAQVNLTSGLEESNFINQGFGAFSLFETQLTNAIQLIAAIDASGVIALDPTNQQLVTSGTVEQYFEGLKGAREVLSFINFNSLSGVVNVTTSGLDVSNFTDSTSFVIAQTSGLDIIQAVTASGALAVYEGVPLTSGVIASVESGLLIAYNALEFEHYQTLSGLVLSVSGLLEENFTPETWTPFAAARTSGLGIYNAINTSGVRAEFDSALITSGSILTAFNELQTGVNNLVFSGVHALETAVNLTSGIEAQSGLYTINSYNAFESAYTSGVSILSSIATSSGLATFENAPITATLIANIASGITSTSGALIVDADYQAYRTDYEYASGLTQEDYTTPSLTAQTQALTSGLDDLGLSGLNFLDVYNNPSNNAEVVGANAALRSGLLELRLIDLETLSGLLNITTSGLTESEYTSASWTALQAARTSGLEIINQITTSGALGIYESQFITSGVLNTFIDLLNARVSATTFNDYTSLLTVLNETSGIAATPDIYTSESFDPFFEAYTSGIAIKDAVTGSGIFAEIDGTRITNDYIISITNAINLTSGVEAQVVTTSLVASFDAQNTLSYSGVGTVWKDLSDANNDATLNGATFSTDFGGVMSFDGNDDFGTTTNQVASGLQDYSIETWIRPLDLAPGKIVGFQQNTDNVTGAYDRHIYVNSNGELSFGIKSNTENIITYSGLSISEWTHVVATYSNTSKEMNLYINGVLQSSGTVSGNPEQYSGYWVIGGGLINGWESLTGSQFYNGDISEIRIYHDELTPEQVLSNYNFTKDIADAALFTLDATRSISFDSSVSTVVLSGVTATTTAFEFDGVNDFIDTGIQAASADYTIEMWFNAFGFSGTKAIFSDEEFGGGNWNHRLLFIDSDLSFDRRVVNEQVSANSLPVISGVLTSNWYHVAVTKSGTELITYMNGSIVSSGVSAFDYVNNGDNIWLGASAVANPSDYNFSGLISVVNYYHRALPSSEILSNYNELLPRHESCVYDDSCMTEIDTLSGLVNTTTSGLDENDFTSASWTPFNAARNSGLIILNEIATNGFEARFESANITSGVVQEIRSTLQNRYDA
jgi:hypothetical protein